MKYIFRPTISFMSEVVGRASVCRGLGVLKVWEER
jgi:hypothetical protein